MLTSAAVTLAHDRLDLYVRDDRELRCLAADRFSLSMWGEEGLAGIDLFPHYCGLIPLCIQDMSAGEFLSALVEQPGEMVGAVSLIAAGDAILDSMDFTLDMETTARLWEVLKTQFRLRLTRSEIEMRTWAAHRLWRSDGSIAHPKMPI